jgi:hypothetical protein
MNYKDLTTPQLRKLIINDLPWQEEEKIKLELKARGKSYKPKHSAQHYIDFIKSRKSFIFEIDETRSGPNFPYVYEAFTCSSQHVLGDSVEECLDKAIAKSKWRG